MKRHIDIDGDLRLFIYLFKFKRITTKKLKLASCKINNAILQWSFAIRIRIHIRTHKLGRAHKFLYG